MNSLTIDELLAEIAAANVGDDGLTSLEWAEIMRCNEATARIRIKRLILAGKMIPGRAPRTSPLNGKTQPVAVYRVAP